MLEGIDVSHHQPPPLNLANVDFLLARVTMGAGGVDKYGWTHLHQGYAAGVEVIAYHYLRGDSAGIAQARRFLDRVDALDESVGPVGLMVDVENPDKPNAPWPLPLYRTILLDFLAEVRDATPRRCLVYGPGAYLPSLNLPAEIAELHPLMLADWTAPYPVPKPWTAWTIHQYSTSGGTLDRNRFDGTREGLRRVLGLLPPAEPSAVDMALGALAGRVRQAMGQGDGPEDFVSVPEGPQID